MSSLHLVGIIAAMICLAGAIPAGAQELVRNPTFEPTEDETEPRGWSFSPYGTDAEALYEPEGGHDGRGAVGVHSRGERERGSWLQVIDLGEGRHLHLSGWYRTEGIEHEEAALLRVTWRREDRDDLVIGSSRPWFEPAEEWTRFELLLRAPDEAVAATIDLFNYYRPGVVWWSEVRAIPALTAADDRLRAWAEQVELLEGEPATDGSNLLPNPNFELDIAQPGTPDFWERGGNDGEGYPVPSIAIPDERIGYAWGDERARTGERGVSVTCHDDQARAGWVTQVPLVPGPWRLEAWYMTEAMDPEPRQGPVARVTALNENNRVILHYYAYGGASEGDWSEVALEFDAPPGTVAAQVQLRNAWAAGTVHWDDAHLGANLERRAELEREQAEDLRLLGEATEMLPRAHEQVQQTAETLDGDAAQLLVAALEWALRDAELAIQAEMGRDAHATLTDLLDLCGRAGEIVADVQLPSADPERDANPYVANLNDAMEAMAERTTLYPKAYEEIDGAWVFRGVATNAHALAWGLLEPRSDLMHDPRLLERVFTHLQMIVDHHLDGSLTPHRDSRDWNIDRFALAPTLDTFLLIDQMLPWAVLPSKREAWLNGLRRMVDYQYDTYGFRWYEHGPDQPRIYPNMDVHYLLLMELAHQIFGDERYAVERDRFVHFMDEGLLPMGGWTYTRMQNECYQYHRHNTMLLARYVEISDDEHARDILYRSRPFYPLMHNPEGMVEHYTDVSWKHTWVAASPAGAEVKAGMFDCAENKRAALNAAHRGHEGGIAAVYASAWWKDIEPVEVRDNWLIYDENTLGPRGQFGTFSFAGTSRETLPTGRGRSTFVGCMVSDREVERRPLDAALQIATIEYRVTPDGTPIRRNSRHHSGFERHSVIVEGEFASQAVGYLVCPASMPRDSDGLDWAASQQWFMTPDRLVGMLSIRSLRDSSAAGVWGRMHFGMDREFEQGADGMFRYGSLIARIHEHTFAGFATDRPESEPGISERSTMLLLGDEHGLSGEEGLREYSAGEEHFYVVEVLPYWSDLSTAVEPIREGRVRGFLLEEEDRHVLLLHNEGDEAVAWRGPAAGDSVTVYSPPEETDGPRARLEMLNGRFAWPPEEIRADPAQIPVANGQFEVAIPAQSHVVVVSER